MPYFYNPTKIKFFNPLTIVLLPVDHRGQVLSSVHESQRNDDTYMKDRTSVVFEADDFYKVIETPAAPEFARIEWNSSKVKLIAVDGQHRLSALKR